MYPHIFAPWRASFGTNGSNLKDVSFCHCGTNLKKQYNNVPDQPCMHCFEAIGSISHWCCNPMDCEYNKVHGYAFAVCAHCFEMLKGKTFKNKYKMEIMKLSLEITRKKIKQKTPFQLRYYLPVFHQFFSCIIQNYYTHSVYLPQEHYNELKQKFEELYNEHLPQITTAIDQYHLKQPLNEEKENERKEEKLDEYQRMKKILIVYSKSEDEPLKETFVKFFHSTTHSMVSVLNDYIHILQHQDHKDVSLLFKECNNKKCKASKKLFAPQKLYKAKNKELLQMVQIKELNENDIVLIEYFDLFHTLFTHSTTNEVINKSDRDLFSKFGTIIDRDDDCKQQLDETQAVGSYSFGQNFVYWPPFKDRDNFVVAKFASLKEEMMTNKYASLKQQQFNLTYKKAVLLKSTNNGKAMKVRFVEIGMPSDMNISISHLMVLLFYCNYYQVQGNFKKFGTRKLNQNEDWQKDVMPRHAEMANYFKLFIEAVLCFGEEVCAQNVVLYHGISVPLLFDEYCPKFKAPFSTTTSLQIAQQFATINGIILGLTPMLSAGDRMYNVEWISAYPDQKEKLFSKANFLRIADIRVAPNILTMNNSLNINALRLFDNILNNGYYFIINIGKQRKKTQSLLIEFLNQYQSLNELDNDVISTIPKYIFDLFCALIERKRKLRFNTIYLIQSEYNCLQKNFQDSLNAFVVEIFQNTYKMSKEYMQEYIWHIEGMTLILFKSSPVDHVFSGPIQFYFGKRKGGVPIQFIPVMKRCQMGDLQKTYFGIKIISLPVQLQKVNIFCSFIVDDMKYCLNGAYNFGVPCEGFFISPSFSNKLLVDSNLKDFTIRYVIRFEVPK